VLFPVGLGGIIQAGNYRLFVTARGKPGQGYNSALTYRETNIIEEGRISSDYNILIKAIGIEIGRGPSDLSAYPPAVVPADPRIPAVGQIDIFSSAAPFDVDAVAEGMTINLDITNKVIPLAVLSQFPAPGGAVGFQQASRANAPADAPAQAPTLMPTNSSFAGAIGARPYGPISGNRCSTALERKLTVPYMLPRGTNFAMSLGVPRPIQLATLGASPESNWASGSIEVTVHLWVIESNRDPS
jgi:hypothetical protein